MFARNVCGDTTFLEDAPKCGATYSLTPGWRVITWSKVKYARSESRTSGSLIEILDLTRNKPSHPRAKVIMSGRFITPLVAIVGGVIGGEATTTSRHDNHHYKILIYQGSMCSSQC